MATASKWRLLGFGIFAVICALFPPQVISHPVPDPAILANPVTHQRNEDKGVPRQVWESPQVRFGRGHSKVVDKYAPTGGVKAFTLPNGNILTFTHNGNILVKTPHDVSIDLSQTGDSYVSVPNGPLVTVSRTGKISIQQINGLAMQLATNGEFNLVRKDGGSAAKTRKNGITEYLFKNGESLLVTKDGTIIQQLWDGSRQRLNSDGILVPLLANEAIPRRSSSTSLSRNSGRADYAGRGVVFGDSLALDADTSDSLSVTAVQDQTFSGGQTFDFGDFGDLRSSGRVSGGNNYGKSLIVIKDGTFAQELPKRRLKTDGTLVTDQDFYSSWTPSRTSGGYAGRQAFTLPLMDLVDTGPAPDPLNSNAANEGGTQVISEEELSSIRNLGNLGLGIRASGGKDLLNLPGNGAASVAGRGGISLAAISHPIGSSSNNREDPQSAANKIQGRSAKTKAGAILSAAISLAQERGLDKEQTIFFATKILQIATTTSGSGLKGIDGDGVSSSYTDQY